MHIASVKREPVGPFSLADDVAFNRWAADKLASCPVDPADLIVEIDNPATLSTNEKQLVLDRIQRANMAIYRIDRSSPLGKQQLRQLGKQFGLLRLDPNMLADEDGVTSLEVVQGKSLRGYIPYTNNRLQWHTDGYYNVDERRIQAFILHCVRPALDGGENALLDPEIVYLYMRKENPEYIQAFMKDTAMTIPANTESGSETRAAQAGPVFSIIASGQLHMRYTARTRSIEWATDSVTQAARNWLTDFLASDIPYIYKYKLGENEGLIANNVLHTRTQFEHSDDTASQRLLYRARYYDRIQPGGELNALFK